MTKFKFLLGFFLLCMTIGFAQQKKYITYTVKQGETMKSIARQYDMTTRDLLKLNPGESRKPRPNTVIIVPNPDFGKVVVKTEQPEMRTYRAKAKETEFGIAQSFGITIEALREANPQLKDGLKIGMLLKIPEATKTTLKDSVNFVLHTVVKDDTYFNLTRRYEVSQSALLKLNPELEEEGLRLGLLLKIKPRSEEDATSEISEGLVEELDLNKRYKVAFLLPYQLNRLQDNDSIIDESFMRQRSLQNIATDFQLGAMHAIDSLRGKGMRIDVQYFDTEYSRFNLENSRQKLQYIVNRNDFDAVDVVVGPLFFENAHWVSKRVKSLVVTPFYSAKQTGLSSGNLIKTSPDDIVYEEKVMAYMEAHYGGQNIVVINDTIVKNQSRLWRVVNRLKKMDSVPQISVIKPEKNRIPYEDFEVKLDSMASNWVVIVSDDNLTTSAAVNGLKGFAERVDIKLFTFKKGRNFDAIDNQFLGKLNFVFGSAEFIDPKRTAVNQFYSGYNRRNNDWPSDYAVRGFDVTYDLLVRLASSTMFSDGLRHGVSDRVSGRFNFDKKFFGSYQNHGVYLIQYTPELEHIMLDVQQEKDQ